MKRLTLSIFFAVAAAVAASVGAISTATTQNDVTFEVAAPTTVEAGELFRIEFIANTVRDIRFTPPAIEGFEVMAGPQEAYGSSSEIDLSTGSTSRIETTTYTYILQGFTAGLHTVSAAHITVNGKRYSTKPVTIEVVAGGQNNGAASGRGSPVRQGSAPEIAADDIFVRAVANRSEVYKGEPVVVTLKLYSRVDFRADGISKLPAFNGFWQQDITPAGDPVQQRETYNNRVYGTWTIKEYLLYPQQSGILTVEPFDASVVVMIPNRSNSSHNIFDQLMGGGANFIEIPKKISSVPVKIEVNDWPGGAPASFDGAVGQFELSATPPPPSMNANASGSYALRLSGTGNFPLIRAPKLVFPTSFEQYNVTTSDNTRHSRTGTSGYREFSYPFIPRSDGFYTIPTFEFSFFNPRLRQYETLSSREMSIEVAADTTAVARSGGIVSSGLSREELKIFGQDIQFIKRGAANLRPKGRVFMWSLLHISMMAFLAALFVIGLVVLRKYVRNMQSDRFVRGKRANKVALKRFRTAEASMKQGDKHGFYDEMLKALWGYMGDKLDIPMAALTKERIREELFERNIPEARSDDYIRIISECEEAQYSPAPSARMNELYREGVVLISEFESAIKKTGS